jgi:pimeloyl-ACP methyl ester carboxylesterase
MAMMGWTSAPFLPFLKTETLIMMGDDDQIVPLANGKFLNFLIPNSELFVVENGGHLFLLSHVEESIEAIRGFLDRGAHKARKAA